MGEWNKVAASRMLISKLTGKLLAKSRTSVIDRWLKCECELDYDKKVQLVKVDSDVLDYTGTGTDIFNELISSYDVKELRLNMKNVRYVKEKFFKDIECPGYVWSICDYGGNQCAAKKHHWVQYGSISRGRGKKPSREELYSEW